MSGPVGFLRAARLAAGALFAALLLGCGSSAPPPATKSPEELRQEILKQHEMEFPKQGKKTPPKP